MTKSKWWLKIIWVTRHGTSQRYGAEKGYWRNEMSHSLPLQKTGLHLKEGNTVYLVALCITSFFWKKKQKKTYELIKDKSWWKAFSQELVSRKSIVFHQSQSGIIWLGCPTAAAILSMTLHLRITTYSDPYKIILMRKTSILRKTAKTTKNSILGGSKSHTPSKMEKDCRTECQKEIYVHLNIFLKSNEFLFRRKIHSFGRKQQH